jgi:transcriptional regulator with XRE-family HTH domain
LILENISALCKDRGVTIAEVERSTGLGNGTIRRWNELNPRTDRLKLVADYFGVTVDDLLKEGGAAS